MLKKNIIKMVEKSAIYFRLTVRNFYSNGYIFMYVDNKWFN